MRRTRYYVWADAIQNKNLIDEFLHDRDFDYLIVAEPPPKGLPEPEYYAITLADTTSRVTYPLAYLETHPYFWTRITKREYDKRYAELTRKLKEQPSAETH